MKINPKCKCRSLEIIRPILAVPKRSPPVEVILPPSPRFRDRLSRPRRCRPTRSQILRERGDLAFMTKRGISLPHNFRFSLKPLPDVPPVTPKSEFQFDCKFEKLPKKFPDLTKLQIPVIRDTGVKLSIEMLGRYFKCADYQFNFLHFWFLDAMVDCIWRSQDDFGFSEEEQKIVLSWVLFFFDLIRDSRNYSREEFFGIFRESIDIAVELIEEGDWNMYHPLKIMEINRADKSCQSDVISERYNTPSALVTPSTMKSKESECDQKKCVEPNDVESSSNESCFCFEKICRCNLEKSSDDDGESRFVPSQLPSKTKVEEESSSESFTSSIHGESVPDYDYLNYLNYCDPDPENLEDMFSDLHFTDEFRRRCKMIPLSYGKDIPAFILFSPSGAAQSSEDSSQPSTFKKSSNTTSESSSLHPIKSDDTKAIMQKLTMYKVMEQRVRDYLDSNVGLSSWQISTMEEEEDNYYKYREEQYGEGEEEEISVIHSKELEIMKDKQFVSFGMLWMNFNDEWLTPKHLTEDLTLYVKDLKDKYKKIYKKHKKKKEKKDKKKKKDKKSDKKSKKSDKNKKKKEKKEKKPKKKGLTEEEKLEKQRLAELEAERIKREIHDKFMFPLQDAIEDDEFFREKFPKWKKVNWRKGKGGKGRNKK